MLRSMALMVPLIFAPGSSDSPTFSFSAGKPHATLAVRP